MNEKKRVCDVTVTHGSYFSLRVESVTIQGHKIYNTKCESCMILRGSETDIAVGLSSHYSQFLSRCGLSMPSNEIKHFVCNSFAIVDLVEDTLLHVF